MNVMKKFATMKATATRLFCIQQLSFSFPPVGYYSINASSEKKWRSSLQFEFELTVQKLDVFNKF